MATKLQMYQSLSEQAAKDITAQRGNWTDFLDSAAKLYKYTFPEQLLIHAQRPDAIACAPIETWNDSFNRWVRRGSKGIALIDDSGSYPRLRYVFDVADTEPSVYNSRPVYIWEMRREHREPVLEYLAGVYDDVDGSLTESFRSIAKQLAREYYEDNANEIRLRAEDSFLEGYDYETLGEAFEDALTGSIAYTLMSRCGFDTADYFSDEDFRHITDFNSPDMVYAIGTAANELTAQVLRDIETVIKKYERQRAASLVLASQEPALDSALNHRGIQNTRPAILPVIERSAENERSTDIHTDRGLSAPGHQTERAAEGSDRAAGQVRQNEESVSERTQDDNVQHNASERNAVPAPSGNRGSGERSAGAGNEAADGEEPAARQGERRDGLDGGDEHAKSPSGGNGTERPDIRLKAEPEAPSEQAEPEPDGASSVSGRYRYYSTQRPISIGTYPRDTGEPVEINHYDTRTAVEDGAFLAWGWLEYDKPLTDKQISDYELRAAGSPAAPVQAVTPDSAGVLNENVISIAEILSASPITVDEADFILRDGGNFDDHHLDIIPSESRSALRIAARFAKGMDGNADFLKAEYLLGRYGRNYHESGKGFDFPGNRRVCAWFTQDGIELAVGDAAKNNRNKVIIPWETAAARIDALIREGRYVSPQAYDIALDNERRELADELWFFYRDDAGGIPDEWRGESYGHPDETAKIKSLLDADETRQAIRDKLEADVYTWLKDDTKTRSWHNPAKLLVKMNAAMNPPVIPPGDGAIPEKSFSYFITHDEIDALLTHGGNYTEGKFRFLSFLLGDHDTKEKVDFFKSEYGNGGGTWNYTNGWQDAEPGKGVSIQRGSLGKPDAEVKLKWPAVIKRTEQLIHDGLYMTRAELAHIPNYERLMLVRQINLFYAGLSEDYERPFPGKNGFLHNEYRNENGDKILDFHYPHEAEWEAVSGLLDNPERVEALLSRMKFIFENTSEDDRYYDYRKTAYEWLSAYQAGTYTLFPGIENLPDPETAGVRAVTPSLTPRCETVINLSESSFNDTAIGEPQSGIQMSLFDFEEQPPPILPSPEEQRVRIEQTNNPTAEADAPAVSFPITQDEIDTLLLTISDEDKERLAAQFADNPRSREAVRLIREIYSGIVETRPRLDGADGYLGILGESLGVAISRGEPASTPLSGRVPAEILNLPWAAVIKRVGELAAEGRLAAVMERQDPALLAEYQQIKADNPGCVVFFQVGDSIEFLQEDADIAAKLLDLPLTYRDAGLAEPISALVIPMDAISEAVDKVYEAGYGLAIAGLTKAEAEGGIRVVTAVPPNGEAALEKAVDAETAEEPAEAGAMQRTVDVYHTPINGIPYSEGDIVERIFADSSQVIISHIDEGNVYYYPADEIDPSPVAMARESFEMFLDNGDFRLSEEESVSEPRVTEQGFTAETVPAAELDFDAAARTVLERVMEDAEFASALNEAQGRAAIRSPLITALEIAVYEHQEDEPQVYRAYHNDDDFNERLYDYVYRQSWELRQRREAEAAVQTTAAQTEREPKPVAEKLLSQDGTDYYLFHFPEPNETPAALSEDSLSLITERADRYVICADVCYLSEDDMSPFGIEFRKMPRDFGLLPKAAQERINDIRPDFLRELIREDLSLRGFVVSDELIEDGLEDYNAHGGKGNVQDISDYIEDAYLTDEPEETLEPDKIEPAYDITAEQAETAQKELEKPPASPPPVFVVNWDEAKHDFDLNLYKDRDIIAYDKDGVSHALGRSGSLTYVTSTGFLWGGNEVPGDIYEQIQAYKNGELTGEQVRENYLAVLDAFKVLQPEETHSISPTETKAAAFAAELENGGESGRSQKPANFRITDDHLGEGGSKTKFRNNLEAIRTLHDIEFDKRSATPDEQEILSRYVGWGGLPQAFDPDNKQWETEYLELNAALSPEEYELARASTLNAHYTSPTVIRAMYEAVERMGFKTGNILEPSCGVGNFFGLLPESMENSKLYGVELDSVTARIAKQLYPQANISEMGYEKTSMPDAFFDLAIGNVPFGNYAVADKRYDKHKFSIHDYFFAKTLDQVRPGGVIAFITSKFTLDKQNPDVRKYIAQKAELLGAVRLPNNAFLKNAGTETTMDIIFLQKRDRPMDIEPDWVHLGLTEDGLPVNRYFLDNPEMVLGRMALDEKMNNKYGSNDVTACLPTEGADLAEQLRTALFNIRGEYTVGELDDMEGVDNHAIPADPSVKNFSYTTVDDTVYFRENSLMYPVELPVTTLERIKGMIALRDCVYELIELQLDEHTEDESIAAKQRELNGLYDRFSDEYGLINSQGNNRAFNADNSYYLLSSLEILNEDGDFERKADMFSKRTIRQRVEITHTDTATEALAVSLAERAFVDLDYMESLTGFSREKLISDLNGVIFLNIGGADDPRKMYVTADEYLSGNVRRKLELARAAQTSIGSGAYDINVTALEAAQPKDLSASEIAVRLGSTWIAPEYVQQFMYELLQTSQRNKDVYQVKYHAHNGEWQVTGKKKTIFSDIHASVTYGTERMNAYQIIDETLNLRDARVYDYKTDADGNERRELNKNETAKAQQKQEQIKQAFRDWIWKDPERRQTLVKLYNERFNSVRPREYDGSHINFSGISPEITMRPHQLNAIAHIMYGGNTLLAHVVGAGKTFEMVGAAMEMKRIGLCHKSLFAVPNHLTEQWAGEFLRLYPSANILVAKKKDFEMRNRKKFCAKIATGDYDAVIIGHSQLEKIPISHERQEKHIREQIWQVEQGIAELEASHGERYSIKQLEKTKKNLYARLTKLAEGKRRDDVVTFEQLGCDRLFVDEAHSFKNLFLVTKMRNVAGLSTSEAQKSSDLFMKCRFMDEEYGNKGVIFATGTPISNSMTEMYTMQRYLQFDTLEAKGLTHFDSWASIFGETQTSIELAPEGTGYRARTRFSRFYNLPELMAMFKDVADIQTADMLNLPVPEVKFENVIVEPSEIQQEMVQELSERAAAVHTGRIDPRVDNMLKITTDGRKIGLDQRLINPMLEDFPGSKVNACTDKVYQIWEETKSSKLTQLVFSDFSTPNKDGRFNIYDDIKAKLIERGIPENEIAFIHDADTETRKKELFAKVRQGKVRVLFGSTFKMGAGTNVQDRLIATHDVDCPWRPADLEQRAGRIVRQGNKNDEVQIFRYATSGTFDSYLWQTVEAKQKFIAQIMSSKSPVRSCEDVDETSLSYAEIKALCAGNPLIAEKMNLDIEVAKLRMLKADHQSQHYRLEDDLLKRYPEQIISVKERIEGIKKDAALYAAESKKTLDVLPGADVGAAAVSTKFPGMTVDGVTYDEKEPAAKALLDSCKTVTNKLEKEIGEYMGFKMSLRLEGMTTDKKFHLLLRANMTYQIELGADSFGNITRINNALADLPKKLEGAQLQLETLLSQQEAAKQELEKPFALTDELSEKETRLALLNAELNIEGSGGMDVVNDPDTRADAAKERYEDSDYDDDYEPDENDIDGGERKPFTLVNPGMTFSYPPEQERRVAYGKTKPPLMEAIRNYNAEKKPPVPGRKSSEHDI